MAYKHSMEPKGSLGLKIAIGVLIVLLIVSVYYPKKLWDDQADLITDSRERMDNINFAVERYRAVHGEYIADLDSLLAFMESDSIVVPRAVFEFERLSLYDAPNDSFLVGFNDLFHFDRIEVETFRGGNPAPTRLKEGEVVDSVVMIMVPKDSYAGVIEPVKVSLRSMKGIEFMPRAKGVDDIYWLVWSPGRMDRKYVPYEERLVPSRKYILFRDLAEIGQDPITGKPFEMFLNTRLTMEGKITYSVVRRGEPDPAVYGNELYTNLFINRLARRARANVDQQLQRDSTLFEIQLQLQNDYFDVELELLRPGRDVDVESSRERMVPADSVEGYRDTDRIRRELFSVSYDSLIRVWTARESTVEKLQLLTYREELQLSKVNPVGVTIRAPFKGTYVLKGRNLLDWIFSVGPIDHPGMIENNDLSWEEKR